MGIVALPAMLKAGYDSRLSTGVIAASGTLAQLIPPSLVLIVMADATGVPIFRMYEHALVPGLLLAAAYVAYVLVVVRVAPRCVPPAGKGPGPGDVLRAFRSLLPPVAIIAATIGSVLTGFATPTESGGFGATATLSLAWARKGLSVRTLRGIVDTTTLFSCCALFIMIGATFFTLPFNAMDGKPWMSSVLSQLPGGETGFLVAAVLLVFFLAFFLDFFEIAFLALPLLMPTVVALGIEPAWFAVLVCIALQTSLHAPAVRRRHLHPALRGPRLRHERAAVPGCDSLHPHPTGGGTSAGGGTRPRAGSRRFTQGPNVRSRGGGDPARASSWRRPMSRAMQGRQ